MQDFSYGRMRAQEKPPEPYTLYDREQAAADAAAQRSQTLRDFEYFQSLYPQKVKELQLVVSEACDEMDYEGSPLYDEYPDRIMLEQLSGRIQKKAELQFTAAEEEPAVLPESDSEVETYEAVPEKHREECPNGSCEGNRPRTPCGPGYIVASASPESGGFQVWEMADGRLEPEIKMPGAALEPEWSAAPAVLQPEWRASEAAIKPEENQPVVLPESGLPPETPENSHRPETEDTAGQKIQAAALPAWSGGSGRPGNPPPPPPYRPGGPGGPPPPPPYRPGGPGGPPPPPPYRPGGPGGPPPPPPYRPGGPGGPPPPPPYRPGGPGGPPPPPPFRPGGPGGPPPPPPYRPGGPGGPPPPRPTGPFNLDDMIRLLLFNELQRRRCQGRNCW